MAARAMVALEGNDGAAGFRAEQFFVKLEKVVVGRLDLLGNRVALDFQFVGASLQHTDLLVGDFHQIGHAVFFRTVFGVRGRDDRLEILEFLHQFEFAVLDRVDVALGPLDLVFERGVFLVLASLELLGLVFGDLGPLAVRLDLEPLSLHFDLRGAGFVVLERALRRIEFPLQRGFLRGHGIDLVEKGLQPLIALLQEEKFLQDFHHCDPSRCPPPRRPARSALELSNPRP